MIRSDMSNSWCHCEWSEHHHQLICLLIYSSARLQYTNMWFECGQNVTIVTTGGQLKCEDIVRICKAGFTIFEKERKV